MNSAAVSPPSARSGGKSRSWKLFLLLFPLLIAIGLFALRQIEVHRMANRTVDDYGAAPSFRLTNQDGKPFGSADLAGKVWIADFIYTTCPGPCPMVSSRMSEMQKPLRNTDVHFVSISVDPSKDTPEVLRGYASELKAQPGRWDFLTGAPNEIYRLSVDGFKLAASGHGGENGQPLHSTRMILVDRRGEIRGYYEATAPDSITRLIADANRLAASR